MEINCKYLKFKILYIKVNLCVCVCVRYRNTHRWTNPHQNWYGGLTLQGPGHRLCFGPPGWTPGVRGGLNRVWRASTTSSVRLGKKFIKQKLQGRSVLVGADHIFVPIIQIWKDLGPMGFWSHGKSFPGKFSKMKLIEHLPNRKMGQVADIPIQPNILWGSPSLPPLPSQYPIISI